MPPMTNEYMREYMAARRAKRKADLIEMLGGKCVHCGATKDLDFDHIDPTTKLFQLSGRRLDGPWQDLLTEAAKCQLLCRPCHIEKTKSERPISAHGTVNRYQKWKCRCDLCAAEMSARRKRFPSRQKRSPMV